MKSSEVSVNNVSAKFELVQDFFRQPLVLKQVLWNLHVAADNTGEIKGRFSSHYAFIVFHRGHRKHLERFSKYVQRLQIVQGLCIDGAGIVSGPTADDFRTTTNDRVDCLQAQYRSAIIHQSMGRTNVHWARYTAAARHTFPEVPAPAALPAPPPLPNSRGSQGDPPEVALLHKPAPRKHLRTREPIVRLTRKPSLSWEISLVTIVSDSMKTPNKLLAAILVSFQELLSNGHLKLEFWKAKYVVTRRNELHLFAADHDVFLHPRGQRNRSGGTVILVQKIIVHRQIYINTNDLESTGAAVHVGARNYLSAAYFAPSAVPRPNRLTPYLAVGPPSSLAVTSMPSNRYSTAYIEERGETHVAAPVDPTCYPTQLNALPYVIDTFVFNRTAASGGSAFNIGPIRPSSRSCSSDNLWHGHPYSNARNPACSLRIYALFHSRHIQTLREALPLVLVVNMIVDNVNFNLCSVAVFLDVSKAFDKICFEESSVPPCNVDLLRSYQTDRSFRICINGEISSLRAMDVGEPQDRVLGSVLHLIVWELKVWIHSV
ncbi:hypothetical protein J6590_102223 [Homalodisca vitripennis]|nr:hypothetical protein J6590_102223 [Homalodisca vitripennis]